MSVLLSLSLSLSHRVFVILSLSLSLSLSFSLSFLLFPALSTFCRVKVTFYTSCPKLKNLSLDASESEKTFELCGFLSCGKQATRTCSPRKILVGFLVGQLVSKACHYSGRLTSGKGYPARAHCVRPVIRSDLQ